MNDYKKQWETLIGSPTNYDFKNTKRLIRKFSTPDFDGELYEQSNAPGSFQKVLLMMPKTFNGKLPAAAVPFYYPDKSVGYDLDTLELLENQGSALARFLVRRGYAVITAESYHISYIDSDKPPDDFTRWREAASKLLTDHPGWTGIGKLVLDTKLIIDMLCEDSRVDSSRIGIAGHSLGGKIAMYTGCLDDRIKVILASDFGIGWDQTNWNDVWYWGDNVEKLKAAGIDHTGLLRAGELKPFGIIAGLYDDDSSFDMMKRAGYNDPSRYFFVNHATGHRPPFDVLEKGYDFLDKFLK